MKNPKIMKKLNIRLGHPDTSPTLFWTWGAILNCSPPRGGSLGGGDPPSGKISDFLKNFFRIFLKSVGDVKNMIGDVSGWVRRIFYFLMIF